ncbi:MAG: GDSL-type esterase/lipase family protein, partial [Thermaurantiacus sp.]
MPRTESRSLPYGAWRLFFHMLALALVFALPHAAEARGQQLVLAFGDSLTAGYQLRPNESFPARLEAELRRQGRDVRVVNAGVSGDTTAQGRARLN